MKLKLTLRKKIILAILPVSIIVFGGAMAFVIYNASKKVLEDTHTIADTKAEEFANMLESEFNLDANICRGALQSMNSFHKYETEEMWDIYQHMLEDVLIENDQYIATWLSLELKYHDDNWTKDYGRLRFEFHRTNYGGVEGLIDSAEIDSDNIGSLYYNIKQLKKEVVTEPYWYTYSGSRSGGQVLETSYCVPLLINNNFAGLLGADLELSRYANMVNRLEIPGNGYAYLISNAGAFISYPDEEFFGKNYGEYFNELEKEHNILQNIKQGKRFDYIALDSYLNTDCYFTYVPITIGATDTPWSLAVVVPQQAIRADSKRIVYISIGVFLLGLLIASIVILVFANTITNPIKKTTGVLKDLAKGEIDKGEKLFVNSGDEIEEMAKSVNSVIDGIRETSEFAKSIGQGELDTDFASLGENDMLGKSLLDMRQSLKNAELEEERRKEEDNKQNWATEGMAKFGEILREHNQSINDLSFNIISKLVDYVDAIQGGLFIQNNQEDEEVFYELMGSVAYNRQKSLETRFKRGESVVGRCAYEQLTIYMEEVPENYVHITSGLGESNPRSILVVPCILNEEVYGIIEIVSFNKFEKHQIDFVEKIGESIASTISNAKVNERTNSLLEQSKQQSEELAAQEEEMRQNLEELQATQEEMSRREAANKVMIQEMQEREEKMMLILEELKVEEDEIKKRIDDLRNI